MPADITAETGTTTATTADTEIAAEAESAIVADGEDFHHAMDAVGQLASLRQAVVCRCFCCQSAASNSLFLQRRSLKATRAFTNPCVTTRIILTESL